LLGIDVGLEVVPTVNLVAGVAGWTVAVADLGALVGVLSQAARNIIAMTKIRVRAKFLPGGFPKTIDMFNVKIYFARQRNGILLRFCSAI
jgi:hypothetical protein